MQKVIMMIVSIICLLLMVNLIYHARTETTMKYFPMDENAKFDHAGTQIKLDNNTGYVEWSINSQSNQPMYLRQDVSLLFENGLFKGVQSKWRQQVSELSMSQNYEPNNSSYVQAITFHHGEIHKDSDSITSLQHMTANHQFFRKNNSIVKVITDSTDKKDTTLKNKLKQETQKQLQRSWDKLLTHFKLDPNHYESIPLTSLVQYNENNLPQQSNQATKQIIGQLWEGLYKHYILELKGKKNTHINNYMPLVLMEKNQTELLVIYELNGEKQLLKQKLP